MTSVNGGTGGVSTTVAMDSHRQQDRLALAGRIVEKDLMVDSNFPQLVEHLRVTSQGVPEVSGLHDNDYPSLSTVAPGLQSLVQLAEVKTIPLPDELLEQFAHMQCNCTMGLFPEVGRAWLAIDSNIFVWTYEDGGDLAYFDGLGETILGAALVKPKTGIFQRHIKYLLCLTTPIEVVLLGVGFSKSLEDVSSDLSTSEMHLIPEPLFSVPSDNTYMPTVVGTSLGRIFLGGKDGCLYELVYQAEEGWFSRKCRKINHSQSSLSFLMPSFLSSTFAKEDALIQIEVDNSRNILYTRSETGNITVYDLGLDGQSTTRVISISQSAILQDAVSVARTIDRSTFFPIIHISAVEVVESSHIHLIVVTHAGVRLYFTAINLNNPQNVRPVTLRLVHIRLPPGFSAVSPPIRPNKVHLVHCRKGTFLMASSQSENTDMLWCLSNDSFAFQSQLMEMQTTTQIDGKTWAIAEVPHNMHVVVDQAAQPPVTVTQHQAMPQKFILISAQGCHVITKLRPVDQLRQLLLDYNGPDSEAVHAFFHLHQEDQACAMCLILACLSPSVQDNMISEWATRACFLYGGEPQIRVQAINPYGGTGSTQPAWSLQTPLTPVATEYQTFQSPTVGSFIPSQVSTPLPFYQGTSNVYGGTTELPPTTPIHGQPGFEQPGIGAACPDIQYSSRHNGLYILFSRIVRPFWNERLVMDVTCQSREGISVYLASSITSKQIGSYLVQLTGIKNFLNTHRSIILPLRSENLSVSQPLRHGLGNGFGTGDMPVFSRQQQQHIQRNVGAEAQIQEKSSICNLQELVERTIEVLGLWRVLYDHQFHVVSSSLQKDYQDQLRSMVFKDLIVGGQQLASILISNLINRYLGDNATTDAVSSRLREVCPSIYRVEDATFSKANELLINAQKENNPHERRNNLQEALKLCKRIVPQVNLQIICRHLRATHCYDGIIDLCLLSASRLDPQNLAMHYYCNGERRQDQQGFQAFQNRLECYKHITDTLLLLSQTVLGAPHASSIPRNSGPPVSISEVCLLNAEEARESYDMVLSLSLSSDDEMCHIAIFNWLMDQNQEEMLLELKSPYLEAYLKKAASQYIDSVAAMDMLWKYSEKNGNYIAAAKILSKLADRHGTDVSLQRRIEYLARAIVCVKGAEVLPSTRTEGEFLHELEEKMEVARIQNQILDTLTQSRIRGIEEAVSRLNADLLDITQLYEDFAFPFNFHECQLAIIHCAGLHDVTLVETLWQNIIDKELDEELDCNLSTKVLALCNKLKSLGKVYVSSSHEYYPLPFLINYLELRSSDMTLDCKWPYSTMVELGISLPKILQVYNQIYKSKDPQWLAPKKLQHLFKVLSHIVAQFVDSPNTLPPNEKRQCTVFFLDAITSYLVDLQALDSIDPTTKAIIDSFRKTQIKLQRGL